MSIRPSSSEIAGQPQQTRDRRAAEGQPSSSEIAGQPQHHLAATLYAIGAAGAGVFNEMHFYDLPWPKAALEQLENEIVMMKVALSYFIEPNLTGKAATRPDAYRSFGLRFDVKKQNDEFPPHMQALGPIAK